LATPPHARVITARVRRVVIAGLVVVVAVVAVWKLARQHGASGSPTTTTSSPAAPGPRIAQRPAAPGSLSGKVTRRDGGAPIAGAVIAIAAKPVGPRTGAAPDAPSTVVVTDASGAWSAPAIVAGSYKVTASAVGFLPASTSSLAVAAGEHEDRVDLALASGGTIVSGTVSDIGGGVIAGARVTMQPISIRARGATDEVIALSGDDGRYLVVDGPRGASRAEATAKVGDDVTITLAMLGALSGRVTAGGAPVKAYDLDCRIANTQRLSMLGSEGAISQQVTADDGRYSADHIVPGSYACTVTSDRGTASDTIVIASGPVQHDFALVAYASVTGTIVDAATGQPRAGITVYNVLATRAQSIAARMSGNPPKTDASGRFELTSQPLGDGSLMMLDGHLPVMPQSAGAMRFTLTAGQRLDLGTIKIADVPRSSTSSTSITITAQPR
jgi:hypothetical protein